MDINTCFETTSHLRSLALYANLVPAITSLILAAFVFMKAVDRPRANFFIAFVVVFAMWLSSNAILWTSNDYYLVAGFWSAMNYLEISFFLLIFLYFLQEVLPASVRWFGIGAIGVAAISFVTNLAGKSVSGFDLTWCNMENSEFLNTFNLGLEITVLFIILGLGLQQIYKARKKRSELTRLSIITASIVLFLGIFSAAEYLASTTGDYTYELYALFALPVFVLLLTVAITNYSTFRLADAISKVLFYIFIVFSGAGFFFVTTVASFVLTSVAFVMTICFGVLLLRSYEREAKIRDQLQAANENQIILIHFITHQIKGFLTKSRNIFAMSLDGDYGTLPDTMRPMIEEGLRSDTKGVNTIQEILNAANIKSGKVIYNMSDVDLKAIVEEVSTDLRAIAEGKGLAFNLELGDAPVMVKGDRLQLLNALKNLIDNSIKYTLTGSVSVKLTQEAGKIRFVVEDTGVGITKEDMHRLFTEGGHGTNSQKVNVESTGFGLYIVKNIIEAHHGKVWAESEGEGKGSRFIAELPA